MEILKADKITDIESHLKDLGTGDLVVFDCDNVLTTVRVGAFSVQNKDFLRNYIKEKKLSKDDVFDKIRLVLVNETTYLVNQQMVALVSSLAQRNIKHMVATAYSVRPLKDIADPMQWRINNLHKMGYFFEKSWADQSDDIILNNLGIENNPIFRKGILFCDVFPKGVCLQNFLEYIGWVPRKIVFVDDSLRNLASVGEFCEQKDIEYIGIEYIESQYISSHIPFSDNLGELQMDYLMKKSIWLKDEDAQNLLD